MKFLWFVFLFSLASCEASVTVFNKRIEALSGPPDDVALVQTFPKAFYKIYNVEGVGSFYLDSRVDIIKNELRAGRSWEDNIVALMKQYAKPGTQVVDIGAHIGTHTISLSRIVGDSGEVIAFEPQRKLFCELVMNLDLNGCKNVIAYRACVGDVFKTVEMLPAVLDNEGGTGIGKGGDEAAMITLDSLQLANVSFMKIDVENFELSVLQGAKETIRKNRPVIIIEIMGNTYFPISDRAERVQKTLQFLTEMGYEASYIQGSWSDWLAIPST